MDLFNAAHAVNQPYAFFPAYDINIEIKRDDLLNDQVSGNKLRKLKYNLKQAIQNDLHTIITFGGAYSNHIAATAAACNILGLNSIGFIRGDELAVNLSKTLENNNTLKTAHKNGMSLEFMSRDQYRLKATAWYLERLTNKYPQALVIPEGGTNKLAVKGTSEILTDEDRNNFDVICVAAGTGGTAAGIIESTSAHQHVFVFSALKGDFLKADIEKYTNKCNFTLYPEDIHGGYARSSDALIEFMNARFRESGIPLEPIYTGKMMYRIEELIHKGFFNAKTRILAIHTGGLQGISGYNRKLKNKGRLLLEYEDYI